jgi:hypothetical protein
MVQAPSTPGTRWPTRRTAREGTETRIRSEEGPVETMQNSSTDPGRRDSNAWVQRQTWHRAVPRTTVAPRARVGSIRSTRWGVFRPQLEHSRVAR